MIKFKRHKLLSIICVGGPCSSPPCLRCLLVCCPPVRPVANKTAARTPPWPVLSRCSSCHRWQSSSSTRQRSTTPLLASRTTCPLSSLAGPSALLPLCSPVSSPGIKPWEMLLRYLIDAVCASGGCLAALFANMQRDVMTNPACVSQEMRTKLRKKKKTSMGLWESA